MKFLALSSRTFLLTALTGAFVFSLPSGGMVSASHRLQTPEPQVETKVEMPRVEEKLEMPREGREVRRPSGVQREIRPTSEGSTRVVPRSLRERVQEILAPAPQPEPQALPLTPFPVPKTVSTYDDSIIGTPLARQEQCVRYLLRYNPTPDISVTPQQLVSYYYQEGEREGIRPDVAFAQALKETGFFRYGGTVTADQNNYCGLGTTSAVIKGAYFPSSQLGVRAHIQHLLAYASTRQPLEPVVDPRYDLVRSVYGTSTLTRWEDLNGRWAVPGTTYGQSILSMFRAILNE